MADFSTQWYMSRILSTAKKGNRIGEKQLAELQSINHTFDAVLREVSEIAITQREGLALQRAVLAREVFQDAVEEFVYNFGKTLKEFREPIAKFPPEIQFFQLRRIVEEIDKNSINTACIKGRENKSLFDECLIEAREQYRKLAKHPDVRKALSEEDAIRSRENSILAKIALDETKLRREKEIVYLRGKLRDLKRSRKTTISFSDWHASGLGNLPVPAQLFLWLFYGFIYIPIYYIYVSTFFRTSVLLKINAKTEAEFQSIKDRLSELAEDES